jgi:PAS domain S-box-containing protein
VQTAQEELESYIAERTAEWRAANEQLERQVAERRRAEEALRRRNYELALLNRSAQAFNSTLDLDQILMTVLEEVRHLLDVSGCSIWLVDPERGVLVARQVTGLRRDVVQGWRLAVGEGLAGWVAQSGSSLIVDDTRTDARHFRDVDLQARLELRSILSLPLEVKDTVVGVLQVLDERPNRFDSTDLMLLEPLAASAAIAIENARLYQETERLRAFNENIVQSMEEGILLEDEERRITFANRRAADLLGCSPAALVGRNLRDIVLSEQQRAKRAQGIASRYEAVLLTPAGGQVPVLVSARPLFDGQQFTGMLSVFTDITERIKAEEALRRKNEELMALNAIATTITQVIDLDDILNATLDKVLEMAKMDAGWIQLIDERAEGRSLFLSAHRGISAEMVQELEMIQLGRGIMSRVIHSREPVVITGALQSPPSGEQHVNPFPSWALAVIPIQAREKVLGALNVLGGVEPPARSRKLDDHDIQMLTAIGHQVGMAVENRRLLEEASEIQILRELDRLRSELIANVSHELRTPLGLIKVFATTLLRQDVEFDRQMQREFLQDIEKETDRLEEIVRNLLDMSRMENGRLHLETRSQDVGPIVLEVIDEMEAHLEGQRLVHDLDEPLVAQIDGRRIAQVLRNLIGNAIKYAPGQGTITVRGRSEGRHVLVQVCDQGIGIPEQDLDRVFERFYRVENPVTQKAGGVGLGLSVCRGIVQAHGGRIWAESVLGEGSVFSFTLPVGSRAAEEPAR